MIKQIKHYCFPLVLALCFVVKSATPSYFDCLKDHSIVLQAQDTMQDCHTPKNIAAKDCCAKLSCPKCFTTTLSFTASIAFQMKKPYLPSPVANLSEVHYHYSDTPERPPKIS